MSHKGYLQINVQTCHTSKTQVHPSAKADLMIYDDELFMVRHAEVETNFIPL